jgi:hypothetical protein
MPPLTTFILTLLTLLSITPTTLSLTVHKRDDTLPHSLVPWEFKGEINGTYFEHNGTIEVIPSFPSSLFSSHSPHILIQHPFANVNLKLNIKKKFY